METSLLEGHDRWSLNRVRTRITTETRDDAHTLVKSLLKNKPILTRLQEDLHSSKSLVQTEAGTEVREEMKRLEQNLKAEHEAEMTELKKAQRDRENPFSIT
jgi:hypothetical protein